MSTITNTAKDVLDAVEARENESATDLDVALGRVLVEFAESGFNATIDAMAQLPTTLGQTTKANSLSVTLASNQDALPITDNGSSLTVDGSLTSVGTVTTVTAVTGITNVVHVDDNSSSLTVDSPQLPAALGQTTMAASLPVAIASNQSAVPVSGTLTAVTSITNVVHVDDNSGSLTVDSPQLPAALGQTTMAASMPVAIASNQSAVPVTGTITAVTSVTNVVHVDDNSSSLTVDGTVSLSGTSAVSMASPPSPPASIFNNKTTVTTAGTRVVLGTSQALKIGVLIRAATGNTGLIYVGDSSVSSSNGYELAPGETAFFYVADRNTINIDASVNSQSVTYFAS